jgi:aryl-alcohol dehydrogenase-like predicted oxidoreductase
VASHWNDNAHGVRRLGFGVGGPHGAPLIPPHHTEKLIRRAFELGVRLFDTAPSYGAGEAERRLGEAMRSLPRHQCLIATKVGITSSGIAGRSRDFSPDGVRRSLDASLKRLRDTRVDWLFLHGAHEVEMTDDLFRTLEELRYEGKVGAIGYCGRGWQLDAAIASGQFTFLMAPVHCALDPEDIERIERARAANLDLIGIEALAPSFHEWASPTSPGAVWRNIRRIKDGPRLPQHEIVPARDCLRWSLNQGAALRVIVSTTRISHLEANVAAIDALR